VNGSIYVVKNSKKIPFYSEPNLECKGNLFVVDGDRIKLIETKNSFSYVEYLSVSNIKFYGWIEDRFINRQN
jgi:hypothetical protein